MAKSREYSFNDRLSFIIAVCAVLISAASFYATYLQADAAEKQVKAMTLPLIQLSHGNFEQESQQWELSFELQNAGIGPAVVKSVSFFHENKAYPDLFKIMSDCCLEQAKTFKQNSVGKEREVGIITKPLLDAVIPGQSTYRFFSFNRSEEGEVLWQALNTHRHQIQASICFCSLLDDCYRTSGTGQTEQVAMCKQE